MVLAETLMGLDKVRFGETEVFGGSPFLLQESFSLNSHFLGFPHILILPRLSVLAFYGFSLVFLSFAYLALRQSKRADSPTGQLGVRG